MNLKAREEFAVAVAREAGAMALQYYKGTTLRVESKADESPVTEADKAVNAFLIKKVGEAWPGEDIVAEEDIEGSSARQVRDVNGYIWFIDPIDGTKEFIKRTGEWSVMIGLVKDGRPVMGVMYQAAKDKLFRGYKGGGAYLEENGGKTKSRIGGNRAPSVPVTAVRSHSHPPVGTALGLEAFMGAPTVITHGSFGLKLALVSSGVADLYVSGGKGSLWDSCSGEAIAAECNITVVIIDSETMQPSLISYDPRRNLDLNNTVVAMHSSLYPAFLKHLQSAGSKL
eukprot:TRINITY_DN2953_c0_g1_i1.p2 TRINITY_DN2953_c0_g1~~TRINITY_DN2953_c0_g1_i1.p2  ORF type:complete len:284 (+),score=59.37 TRINITY_DN2953_c0_g1_i1:1087-1938(+)